MSLFQHDDVIPFIFLCLSYPGLYHFILNVWWIHWVFISPCLLLLPGGVRRSLPDIIRSRRLICFCCSVSIGSHLIQLLFAFQPTRRQGACQHSNMTSWVRGSSSGRELLVKYVRKSGRDTEVEHTAGREWCGNGNTRSLLKPCPAERKVEASVISFTTRIHL